MISEGQAYATVPVTDIQQARAFYGGTLGFPTMMEVENAATMYSAGDRTIFLVYAATGPSNGQHTTIGWLVSDLPTEVAALKAKGVAFEDYDLQIPGVGQIKTENSIATTGPVSSAWFKDPEGNVLSMTALTM
jgi:catechol 2,3-dioxygenase-like lactoylglutathione lyase family enzyme